MSFLPIKALCGKVTHSGWEGNSYGIPVKLLKWAGQPITKNVSFSDRRPTNNDIFVSAIGEGTITACYFHITKKHQATVIANAGKPISERRNFSTAPRGRWACVRIPSGKNNKSYYKTL